MTITAEIEIHHTMLTESDMRHALVRAHATVTHCLICNSAHLRYVGAFRAGTPALWFPDLASNTIRLRLYALCRRCLRKAKKTHGSVVDEKMRGLLAAEARGTRH